MPSLSKLQETLLNDIYTGSSDSLEYLDARVPDVEGRLNIYKNNTRLNLIDTLKNIYPVTHQLVGEEFFKTMARHYVIQVPMEVGNRNAYGSEFSDFINGFSEAKSLPYLSDMARLEYAYFNAGVTEEKETLTQEGLQATLGEFGDVSFELNSNASYVDLTFNVDELWFLHQSDGADFSSFELIEGSRTVLVLRDASQMTWMKVLSAETAAFLADVSLGKSFAESMQIQMEKEANLEALQMDFGYLLSQGAFTPLNGEWKNDIYS